MKPPVTAAPSPNAGAQDPRSETASPIDDEATGVPWFCTWRGVYVFVFCSFIVWVALLTALTMFFS
jgi:hypothetical protein